MSIPLIKLANGQLIPQVGLGLWQIKDQNQFIETFQSAIKAGYRMFDSAQFYQNEQFLGQAIKESNIKRSDLFITTKIAVNNFGYNKTKASFKTSLQKIDSNYIDLMLLHFPVSILRKKSWLALEEILQSGQVKSIGVSNYTIRHLEEMKKYASVMPVINQVELHLFLQQPELITYCRNNNIAIEAYSPLAHGLKMDNPIVIKLAQKYSKSYAQIMLRFLIQLGLIVIPKSVTKERLQENINLFDFKIDESDIKKLKSLNSNLRTCWNPSLVP